MRTPLYDVRARRTTVSVTINADLQERARAAGLDLSEVAEAAVVARERASVQAEIDLDLTAYNTFVEEHGSFAEAVREHDAALERDIAV